MTETTQAAGLTDEQIDEFVPGAAVQDRFSLHQVRYAIRPHLAHWHKPSPTSPQGGSDGN